MTLPALTPLPTPRRPRGVLARAVAGLWLALYLVMVAGVPVLDGAMEHTGDVVVHIEDANGGHCPASHGTESCELCQFSQGFRALTGTATALPVATLLGKDVPQRDALRRPVTLAFLDGHSSRAPPALG